MEQNNMMFTLEEHFKNLSEKYEQVREVYSLWVLLKKDISEKLNNVYRSFPYFSKHDASHSRTIITNIELFLGEERIRVLSATDTFMLLICAYSHDFGMALELEEILEILMDSDGKFKQYLRNSLSNGSAAGRLINYYEHKESDGDLKELYHSIILMLQDYNRPTHWRGVEKIDSDYENLFLGRVKARFVKSIIKICQMHGKDVEEILNLSRYSTGMFADVFHPRFIAAMIRLGDLLDLDNNRFSLDFAKGVKEKNNNIPKLSRLHYLKHEAITHFFIGPTHIDVEASCEGEDALSVARELYDWLHWLENDCAYLKAEWDMIAQRDFGAAPRVRNKKILVNGTEYQHFVYDLRMELPSDKIFNLLAGSNVYDSKYVAFREIIQNAIDATLLQMWKDFYNGLSPEQQRSDYTKLFADWCLSKKFEDDYKILVNVIEDSRDKSVYVEVIDQGIGIDDEDLKYMCRIGENNICNPQRHQLISKMPDWLIPSGVFGIGLQSAFQLTDEIEFFTKKANRTPRHIRFSSYSSNKGKIEVSKCPNTYKTQFEKLSTQGTLVKIRIKSHIFDKRDEFGYFDLEFDQSEVNEHIIRVEIIKQFMHYFESNSVNYFPIVFTDFKVNGDGTIENKPARKKTWSCTPFYKLLQSGEEICIKKAKTIKLYCWHKERNLFLTIDIPPCKLIDETNKIISFERVDNSFTINYKFNHITEYRQLFGRSSVEGYSKLIELNSNIIRCFADILDKNTDKYLNIDRNVLKYGEINYKDIVEVETKMFTALCNIIIKQGEKSQYLNLNFFPIISILFARFVDKNILETFVENFKKKLEEISVNIDDEVYGKNINLLDLLGFTKHIGICHFNEVEGFHDLESCESDLTNANRLFEHFPRHFFVPKSIKLQKHNNKNFIIYYCKIRNESCFESTEIDENCWKYDCLQLMKSDPNQLIKTVFKPVGKYKELFVGKIPKTFRKSIVFENILDNNISIYILSPFEQSSAKKIFDCKHYAGLKLNDCIDEIKRTLINTTHFKKCVNFVKNSATGSCDESIIIQKYLSMVEEIIRIFNENC